MVISGGVGGVEFIGIGVVISGGVGGVEFIGIGVVSSGGVGGVAFIGIGSGATMPLSGPHEGACCIDSASSAS